MAENSYKTFQDHSNVLEQQYNEIVKFLCLYLVIIYVKTDTLREAQFGTKQICLTEFAETELASGA